jgi:hypothetical protein|eukprot:CAMPEP_0174291424 /NCGR_PEP_ID=MMETSP0809-20121228/32011_1 /TAXON_ID=73025 ORGANISM="Eutreptiella gymnastica-like, Strain CCMP1594" /NCGR_SAMPLE_ID=MMETSP0809 /ASSEMBLY_ACC=CAM_ASM_000658 /LENGTH=57 /DNA_ID=CAMNT_0015390725 /DNA_START=290 /DNA_END=463 /DNA_ORIENTATION=+
MGTSDTPKISVEVALEPLEYATGLRTLLQLFHCNSDFECIMLTGRGCGGVSKEGGTQ